MGCSSETGSKNLLMYMLTAQNCSAKHNCIGICRCRTEAAYHKKQDGRHFEMVRSPSTSITAAFLLLYCCVVIRDLVTCLQHRPCTDPPNSMLQESYTYIMQHRGNAQSRYLPNA